MPASDNLKDEVFQHLSSEDYSRYFKLHRAAFLNDVILLKAIINEMNTNNGILLTQLTKISINLCVNAKDDLTNTPLHYAALNNSVDAIHYLVSLGAEVDCENSEKETPLLLAADYDAMDAVTCLLKYGAYIDHANKLGYTPLIRAANTCSWQRLVSNS